MTKLDIAIQGVKGGRRLFHENKGCATIFIKDKYREQTGLIVVDAFKGFGETYQRNENNVITNYSSHNVPVFCGTFEDLLEKLTT